MSVQIGPPIGGFAAVIAALLFTLLAVMRARQRWSSDLELARAAATGGDDGQEARRAIAARLLDRVRTTVFYLAGPDRDRDDLVQAAMLAILRGTRGFRGEAKLETWADRITVRVARKQLALRSRNEARVADAVEVAGVGADNSTSPDAAQRRRQLQARLAGLLQRIPDKRRDVVMLACVHQYKLEEIAEMTASPLNTVRERLRVGRKELRALILDDPTLDEWVDEVLA